MHMPPRRRPAEPHGGVNEGARLRERRKPPRLRRVADDERRIDAKVIHAACRLPGVTMHRIDGHQASAAG
jgi:hypothetical protein